MVQPFICATPKIILAHPYIKIPNCQRPSVQLRAYWGTYHTVTQPPTDYFRNSHTFTIPGNSFQLSEKTVDGAGLENIN